MVTTAAQNSLDRDPQLRTHLADFMAAYKFARRLKTLSGLTPCECVSKAWSSEPDRFIVNPIHQVPGLIIQYLGLGFQAKIAASLRHG